MKGRRIADPIVAEQQERRVINRKSSSRYVSSSSSFLSSLRPIFLVGKKILVGRYAVLGFFFVVVYSLLEDLRFLFSPTERNSRRVLVVHAHTQSRAQFRQVSGSCCELSLEQARGRVFTPF